MTSNCGSILKWRVRHDQVVVELLVPKTRIFGMARPSSDSTGKRKIHKVMKEYKKGDLKSGSGGKVKSRKQAVAIALSEARKAGARIPRKKAS
jgi:hypothetical protein